MGQDGRSVRRRASDPWPPIGAPRPCQRCTLPIDANHTRVTREYGQRGHIPIQRSPLAPSEAGTSYPWAGCLTASAGGVEWGCAGRDRYRESRGRCPRPYPYRALWPTSDRRGAIGADRACASCPLPASDRGRPSRHSRHSRTYGARSHGGHQGVRRSAGGACDRGHQPRRDPGCARSVRPDRSGKSPTRGARRRDGYRVRPYSPRPPLGGPAVIGDRAALPIEASVRLVLSETRDASARLDRVIQGACALIHETDRALTCARDHAYACTCAYADPDAIRWLTDLDPLRIPAGSYDPARIGAPIGSAPVLSRTGRALLPAGALPICSSLPRIAYEPRSAGSGAPTGDYVDLDRRITPVRCAPPRKDPKWGHPVVGTGPIGDTTAWRTFRGLPSRTVRGERRPAGGSVRLPTSVGGIGRSRLVAISPDPTPVLIHRWDGTSVYAPAVCAETLNSLAHRSWARHPGSVLNPAWRRAPGPTPVAGVSATHT